MTSERTRELLNVVDHLLNVEEEWSQSEDPITEEFEDAIDGCIEVFAGGDLPANCRDLAAAVMDLAEPWDAYKTEAVIQGDPSFLPSPQFWKRLKTLRTLCLRRDRPAQVYLEPIEELTRQRVPPDQICRMYGFLDDRGHPNLQMLAEEKAKPGTHTDRAKGWMPPQERRALERQQERMARLDRVQKAIKVRTNRQKHEQTPAAESWESLLTGGISAEQIARMKRCTVGDVMAKARELKLPPPPVTYDPTINEAGRPNLADDDPAPDLSSFASETDEGASDEPRDDEINHTIAQLIDAGNTDDEIKIYVENEFGARINARRIGNVRKTLESVANGET